MASPYYRGSSHNSGGGGPMYRPNSNGSWGSKDKVDRAGEANVTLMELENNQRWAELGGEVIFVSSRPPSYLTSNFREPHTAEQVELLKGLSHDINQEVKSQNSFLDGMSAQFGSTTQMFKSTIGKLGVMLNTGGSNHMLYLVVFVIFVFLVLYYLMSRK